MRIYIIGAEAILRVLSCSLLRRGLRRRRGHEGPCAAGSRDRRCRPGTHRARSSPAVAAVSTVAGNPAGPTGPQGEEYPTGTPRAPPWQRQEVDMVRVFASLACAVALTCVSARPSAAQLRYDAFQWFGVGEPPLQGAAEVSQAADGSWSARLVIENAPEGRYLYRLVVPTRFYRRPPGTALFPAGWVPVNVCILEATGDHSACALDDVPLGNLADFLELGVVEVWAIPADPRHALAQRWGTAPLHLAE